MGRKVNLYRPQAFLIGRLTVLIADRGAVARGLLRFLCVRGPGWLSRLQLWSAAPTGILHTGVQ